MANRALSPIETSDVLPIFPTFVWKTQFKTAVYEAINNNIIKILDEMRQSLPKLKPGEHWQSQQTLQELDEFNELLDCAKSSAKNILTFLKIGYDTFEITGCWASISAKGTPHGIHSHPNNFLSGVYYVQTHEGADTINFHDPRMQTGIIRPPVTRLTAENTDQVVVKVKNGTLLMFPSWLQHSVAPNKSDQNRISVSFNMMFSAYAERMSKPLW